MKSTKLIHAQKRCALIDKIYKAFQKMDFPTMWTLQRELNRLEAEMIMKGELKR